MPWRLHEVALAAVCVVLTGGLVYALTQPAPASSIGPSVYDVTPLRSAVTRPPPSRGVPAQPPRPAITGTVKVR